MTLFMQSSMVGVIPMPTCPCSTKMQEGLLRGALILTKRQLQSGWEGLMPASEAQTFLSVIHTQKLELVGAVCTITKQLSSDEPNSPSMPCLMCVTWSLRLSGKRELASRVNAENFVSCLGCTPGPEKLSKRSKSEENSTSRIGRSVCSVTLKVKTVISSKRTTIDLSIGKQIYNEYGKYQWKVLRKWMAKRRRMRIPSSSRMTLLTRLRMSPTMLVRSFFQFTLENTCSDLKSGQTLRKILRRVEQEGLLQSVSFSSIFLISRHSLTTAVQIFHSSSSSSASQACLAFTNPSSPTSSSGWQRSWTRLSSPASSCSRMTSLALLTNSRPLSSRKYQKTALRMRWRAVTSRKATISREAT